MNGGAGSRPRLRDVDVLDVWDRAAGFAPAGRATAVLAAALPGHAARDVLELTIGARDRLLLELLRDDFTSTLDGVATCSGCDEPVEVTVPCAQLLSVGPIQAPQPIELDGRRIVWRLPTCADLIAATASGDANENEDDAARLLLQRCLAPTATPGVDETQAMAIRAALAEAIGRCDPLAEILLDVQCPACASPQTVVVDVGDYVWQEISARAQQLLVEVDALARAYGWTEAEVLELPRKRRRAYLELADG